MTEQAAIRGSEAAPAWQRPAFKPGNDLARKHSFFASKLDDEERAEVEALVEELRERVPAGGAALDPLLELTAFQAWRLRRAFADLAEHGLVRSNGKPAAILTHLQALETRMVENFERLALTPKSAAALGLQLLQAQRANLDALNADELAQLRSLLERMGITLPDEGMGHV